MQEQGQEQQQQEQELAGPRQKQRDIQEKNSFLFINMFSYEVTDIVEGKTLTKRPKINSVQLNNERKKYFKTKLNH